MKLIIFVFLMTCAGGAHAAELIQCQLEGNYVSLQFIEQIDSYRTQIMIFEVGKEQDWNDSYKVRRLCETIRAEIKERVGQRWSEEECDYPNPGTGIQYKQIGFQITPGESELLYNHSQTIWFSPKKYSYAFDPFTPIDKDFIRIISPATDSECNVYHP